MRAVEKSPDIWASHLPEFQIVWELRTWPAVGRGLGVGVMVQLQVR